MDVDSDVPSVNQTSASHRSSPPYPLSLPEFKP